MVFGGSLRLDDPAAVLAALNAKLEASGKAGEVRLFMLRESMADPLAFSAAGGRAAAFQEAETAGDVDGRVCIVALGPEDSAKAAPPSLTTGLPRWIRSPYARSLCSLMAVCTAATFTAAYASTGAAGATLMAPLGGAEAAAAPLAALLHAAGLDGGAPTAVELAFAREALPIGAAVVAGAAAHDLGRRGAALAHGVKLGQPVLLPSINHGFSGAATRIHGHPKSRTALFDVGAAGVTSGLAVGGALLLAGLVLTATMAPADVLQLPLLPLKLLHSSALSGLAAELVQPGVMSTPSLDVTVPMHPLTIAGLTATVVSALHAVPIGASDGGRMLSASHGRGLASAVSEFMVIALLVAVLVFRSGIALGWGLAVLFAMHGSEPPCHDEVNDIDVPRRALHTGLSIVAALALVPYPF